MKLTAGLVDVTLRPTRPKNSLRAWRRMTCHWVEPGTDQEAFGGGARFRIFDGGPFPDFFLNNAEVGSLRLR